MKKTIVALALVASTATIAVADYDSVNRKIGESGYSPTLHVVIGATVSAVTYKYLPDGWNPVVKGLTALVTSSVVGFTIESLDRNFNNRDFYDYIGGGAVGIIIGGSF